MQTKILHKKFYQVNSLNGREYSPEALERENKIKLYKQLVLEGCSRKMALKAIKVSRSTYYSLTNSQKCFSLKVRVLKIIKFS